MSDEATEASRETDEAPEQDAPPQRVKGEHTPGSIPGRALLRIVVIGVPVMVIAWYFLRWVHGGGR